MEYENFYEALRYHLEKKGYGGQSLVCRHTDIPRSYLSRIVKKDRRAGVKTQKKIARFFGYGLGEFVDVGRRIILGEDPEYAGDLLRNLPEEHLIARLTDAVRKEVQTAQLLNQAQLLYADIVENSRQMILRFDERLQVTFANTAAEKLTGVAREALPGRNWLDLIDDRYRAELGVNVENMRGSGGSFSMEVAGASTGRWMYLTVTIFPGDVIGTDRGQLVGFDTTKEVEVRQKLAASERDLNTIYNGSPDMMATVDALTGIIRKCNQTMCAKLGYDYDRIVGRPVLDFCHETCLDNAGSIFACFSPDGEIVDRDLLLRKQDGGLVPVLLNVTAIRDEEDGVVSANCVFRDQTERRKLIDRLRFIQHGVEESYVPTLWIGDDAGIVYVNKAVCQLLGYSREELRNMHVWDINPLIPREDWPDTWAWFLAEKNVEFAGRYRRKNGEVMPVSFRVSNLEYPDGRRYNVVFVNARSGRKASRKRSLRLGVVEAPAGK